MKAKLFKHLIFLCLVCTKLSAQNTINVIPIPVKMTLGNGVFHLTASTFIKGDTGSKTVVDWLQDFLHMHTGMDFRTSPQSKNNSILLSINKTVLPEIGDEGYVLNVNHNSVLLSANTAKGLFNGVQTLLQLFPSDIEQIKMVKQNQWTIPAVSITDYPRFAWRGLMIDVSRHFFTIDEVKRLIDQMVVYKFNILHLHLTDDQGWRLQIKKLPELTKIGAWRVPRTGVVLEPDPPQEGETATYGGFYTRDEIKDLIVYASQRHVNILPEIDFPGHSMAAIASYPNLSCTKSKYKVACGQKYFDADGKSLIYSSEPLCAGNEYTYEFCKIVIDEVAELFPFEYIHIGGDECYKGFWEKCDDCKKKMTDNGLKDVNELQSYFIRRLEKMLQQKGKKLIGWDEILEGGLAPNATVMSWRGMDGGIAAAKANHHVVMSPNNYAYLDLYQGDPAIEPPTYSMLRFKTVYEFEPVPEGIDASFILGGQGNLWTESVPTFRQAEYMFWPRSFALAEVLWSPKSNRNWTNFVRRTEVHLQSLSRADINFASSFYDVIITPLKDEKGDLQIQLSTEIDGLQIYYSFDNTYSDHHSLLYKQDEKLTIPKNADTFRVITYRDGKPVGRMITVSLADLQKRIN